jgi:hypothetical protein
MPEENEPADLVDMYADRGYTVFAMGDKANAPNKWPWTEFAAIDDSYENRDPEDLGVVAFPAAEFNSTIEHTNGLFTSLVRSTRTAEGMDASSQLDLTAAIIGAEDYHVPQANGGQVVLAHPARYYDSLSEGMVLTKHQFERYSREQGLIGMEVYSNNSEKAGDADVELWDELLTELAPHRLLWGFGVDDVSQWQGFYPGGGIDIRWTTVLLHDEEFDPSDQRGSRIAAAQAYQNGRTLFHTRPRWDDESEEPATVPQVSAIRHDEAAGTITVEASEYDDLEWISSGEVVSTEPTLELEPEHAPYVRAQLRNDDGGRTAIQPIAIAGTDDSSPSFSFDLPHRPWGFSASHDADSGDVTLEWQAVEGATYEVGRAAMTDDPAAIREAIEGSYEWTGPYTPESPEAVVAEDVADTEYTVSEAAAPYYFVRAVSDAGASRWSSVVVPATLDNLLTNPSFELDGEAVDGDPIAWNSWGDDGAAYTTDAERGLGPHDGEYFGANGADSEEYTAIRVQQFSNFPPGVYRLSGQFRGEGSHFFRIDGNDGYAVSESVDPDPESWSEVVLEDVEIRASTPDVRIRSGAGWLHYDSLRLEWLGPLEE